jgi:hypothetical protein
VLQIIQYNDFRKRRLLAKCIKAPELMESVFWPLFPLPHPSLASR